ncbi:hypothetical protein SpCBS45565_g02804 [Spizellomyces sp. 'palustris']|nr:hypothetical protein SpCBS45565_g02804 [Spizellomyces sp. 'palustris']
MNNDTRASKIYDFVAHNANGTCLRIGPKSGRVMVTGGEDRKVNLWAIGKTAPILSLSGHASAIECVTLDWPEEIVVAGSSSGTIKLWDLEHAKVIRTLAGHKSAARCVEFHPFGEFFASGSSDSSVKIWDVRRKGCIQTYHGHQNAVNVLRITPDGRWIATGGSDATVKIWDMTAGKLLHSYSDHTSAITSLAFNPSEFLMVSAGADNVLRFYDLQTFECISATPASTGRPEALQFDTEGHEVYAAYTDSLQIWTWEPAVCHDVISVSWPNIADMRILLEEGKVLGGALDQNFVSVWGVDITPRLSPTDRLPPDLAAPAGFTQGPESPYGGVNRSNIDTTELDIGRLYLGENQSARIESSLRGSQTTVQDDIVSKIAAQRQEFAERHHTPPPSQQPNNAGTQRTPPYGIPKSMSSPYMKPEPSDTPPYGRSMSTSLDRLNFSEDAGYRPATAPGSSRSADEQLAQQLQTHASRGPNSFVPSGNGQRLLNLDVAKFIQNAQRRAQPLPLSPSSPGAPPPTSDNDIIDSLTFRHASITSILNSRLTSIRCIRQTWDEANIRQAIETMIELKDSSVCIDLLRIINLKPKLLTLDVAILLLPMLNELLFEMYEDFIVTACATIRLLVKSFSHVIISTMNADSLSSPGVDISREDRIQRCRACHHGFIEISTTLEELKRSGGQVGGAVRETLKDLAVFAS